MTTNSSAAAAAEAGHVSLMNGRPARARRDVAGIVRYADAAGRTRTASADVASTFGPLTAFDLDRDHGVAYIEAAGQGVRILTAITVDQHDAAFGASAWPTVERAALHGAVDSRRVAIGGQWYDVTRVQMPDGERRRLARQYNGYGDGRPAEREISMRFGCAWSPVEVVGWTEAEIEAEHEADAERDEYAARADVPFVNPIGPSPCAWCGVQGHTEREHDAVTAAAAAADQAAAEQLAEFGEWGKSPADILAEPDVDTSGCSNPWHRGSALYARRGCSECPPAGRPVEVVELPAPIELTDDTLRLLAELEAHQLNDKVDAVASVGLPMTNGQVADTLAGGNPNVCSHGYRFENGLCPNSLCGASTFEPTVEGPINDRMVITLRYFNDPTPERAVAIRALRGQHTGTMQALKRRRLTEPIDAFPFTALTALGRQTLANYDRTDPQT